MPNQYQEALGRRLTAARERLGLTRGQVGALCGMDANKVRYAEEGRGISTAKIEGLAKALQTPVLVLHLISGSKGYATPEKMLEYVLQTETEKAYGLDWLKLLDRILSLPDDEKAHILGYMTTYLDRKQEAKNLR